LRRAPALPEVHAHLAALHPPRAMVVQRVHEARQLALGLAVPGPVASGALPVHRADGRPAGQLAARRDAAPAQLEPQPVAARTSMVSSPSTSTSRMVTPATPDHRPSAAAIAAMTRPRAGSSVSSTDRRRGSVRVSLRPLVEMAFLALAVALT
jgi:hypothetical protein